MINRKSVKLSNGVASQIHLEATSFYPEESGGLLLGWNSGDDIVVAGLVPGGPEATRTRISFHPDHNFQLKELAQAYTSTSGDLDYVGEWHSHPNGVLKPSWIDRRTLRKMDSSRQGAIMLIVSTDKVSLHATAWSVQSRWRMTVKSLSVATFEAPSSWPKW